MHLGHAVVQTRHDAKDQQGKDPTNKWCQRVSRCWFTSMDLTVWQRNSQATWRGLWSCNAQWSLTRSPTSWYLATWFETDDGEDAWWNDCNSGPWKNGQAQVFNVSVSRLFKTHGLDDWDSLGSGWTFQDHFRVPYLWAMQNACLWLKGTIPSPRASPSNDVGPCEVSLFTFMWSLSILRTSSVVTARCLERASNVWALSWLLVSTHLNKNSSPCL